MFNGALNVTLADKVLATAASVATPEKKLVSMSNNKIADAITNIGTAFKAMIGNTVIDSTQQASVDWFKKHWYWVFLVFLGLLTGLFFFIKWVIKRTNKKGKKSLYK